MKKLIYFIATLFLIVIAYQKATTTNIEAATISPEESYTSLTNNPHHAKNAISYNEHKIVYEESTSYLNEIVIKIIEMEPGEGLEFSFSLESKHPLINLSDNPLVTKGSNALDCKGFKDCKKCRSRACVSRFIDEKIDKYGSCTEFRVDKTLTSATVYARPCPQVSQIK